MNAEQKNLELSKTWERLYNEDADKMATECYAENCDVQAMGGPAIHGQAALREVEKVICAAAPRRYMRVAHRHACGDTVIVESVLFDPDKGDDWNIPFIAVLTIAGGKIVTDRTYGDFTEWPGFS